MLRSVVVAVHKTLLRAVLAGFFACFVLPQAVAAQTSNTQVDTLVCSGTSSNAAMTIDTPQSDRVINHSPITIQGSVHNVSQIDIYVDDDYAGTVAVSQYQTSFTASQGLTEGTHTLRFVGNDICQHADVVVEIVVTYHPDVPPPTLVDNGVVVQGPQTITAGNPPTASGSPVDFSAGGVFDLPVFDTFQATFQGWLRELDIDATANDGGVLAAALRITLFTIGAIMLFFAAFFVRAELGLMQKLGKLTSIPLLRRFDGQKFSTHFHRWKVGTHIGGLLLVLATFVV